MSEIKDILGNSDKGKLPEEMLMAYLEGKLTPEQQHEVEAWLAEEGMEGDAVEGLKELPAEETKQLVNRLNHSLHHELAKKKRRREPVRDNQWTLLAVFLVLLLCVLAYFVIKAILT